MPPLEARLKARAYDLGFGLVGIAPAGPADGFDRLREWLARGYAGTMDYMARHEEARRDPSAVFADVRSVVMVGLDYAVPSEAGNVARYARGPDYHDLIRGQLGQLLDWLRAEVSGCTGRAVTDTAPLLERDFARRAGLGWFGKNTMLINRQRGSFFLLGALLTDVLLAPDPPHTTSHCGTCTACLDVCPTDALIAPGWLDARRCVSYLTIELRGAVPEELREGVGGHLFGCDDCQDVCPWNRKAAGAGIGPIGFPHRPELAVLDPRELLHLDAEEFRRRFRDTALSRAKRAGLVRNACLVLGNTTGAESLPDLDRLAVTDPDASVREAAAWAAEQIRQRFNASPGPAARTPPCS